MATKITKLTFAAIGAFGLIVSLFAAGALSALQGASGVYGVAPISTSSQAHRITITSFTTSPFTSTATPTSNTTNNWAGYVSTGGTYTSISGSWKVPTVTPGNETMAADATWIGIGGESSSDLIQVGTQNMVQDGQVSSGSFYERLPETSVDIPDVNVSVGDAITASVKEVSPGVWSVSIADMTNGESFTNTVSYNSSESSAEWIQEAPSTTGSIIPLDQFSPVTFTSGSTTKDGTAMSIGDSNAQALTIENSLGQALTATSDIDSRGSGFTVARTTADSENNDSFGQYDVTAGGSWNSQPPSLGHVYFRYF